MQKCTAEDVGRQRSQGSPARPASVVRQPRYRPDADLAQTGEPLVGPGPVEMIRVIGRDALPQDRVSKGADAQPGKTTEIIFL